MYSGLYSSDLTQATGKPMKKLFVTIHAELEVPDDWELARHPSGISVLKIGEHYV